MLFIISGKQPARTGFWRLRTAQWYKVLSRVLACLLCISTVAFVGCGGGPTEADMREWFKWATGLALPEQTTIIDGKEFMVFPPGVGTYYVKMKVSANFKRVLEEHFEETTWSIVSDDFSPPRNWHKKMPFWDLAQVEGKRYWTRDNFDEGDIDNGGFYSVLSYDEESGTVYFVGLETWGGV